MTGPAGYDVYWGDFHKHATEPVATLDRIDEALVDASHNVDVYPVLCYPFTWFAAGDIGFEYRVTDRDRWGMREETVQNRPRFLEWWERIQRAVADHNDPGEFVTFPGYEWNGNRRAWGDHNVIHFAEGGPLDDAWKLPALFDHLHGLDMPALAIPHHTAYKAGERAKDWELHDPALSPVMEVYSTHGSSEGVGTPVPMDANPSMGPRASGGSFQDALERGHRVGVIASNDGGGLPGSWGDGVAGLWATDLTREGVWDALTARRTYGTTGDRITLWYELDGEPMGSVVEADGPVTATVEVDCARPLDRIELVAEGRVRETYTHASRWEYPPADQPATYSVLIELGWGPTPEYGDWHGTENQFDGELTVTDGDLAAVQPRFNGWGQRYDHAGDACSFSVTTERDSPVYEPTQGFVCTVSGTAATTLSLALDRHEDVTIALGDLVEDTHVVAFTDDCYDRIAAEFGRTREEIDNPDVAYHNARKAKFHPAAPATACRTTVEFTDLPADRDHYYVRLAQRDGQYAWGSPVWIE